MTTTPRASIRSSTSRRLSVKRVIQPHRVPDDLDRIPVALVPRRNRHKRPILAAPHQVNNLTMPPHASLHFLRRRPSPNELTSTHHKGPFGGTPWHRRGDSCHYGSGSQVAARPAFGDSGKGLGDALLVHAEPAGDLGLRAATASQRHDQLVAAPWCSGHLTLSRPAPRPDVAPSGCANRQLHGLPAQLETDTPMRYVGHIISSGASLG